MMTLKSESTLSLSTEYYSTATLVPVTLNRIGQVGRESDHALVELLQAHFVGIDCSMEGKCLCSLSCPLSVWSPASSPVYNHLSLHFARRPSRHGRNGRFDSLRLDPCSFRSCIQVCEIKVSVSKDRKFLPGLPKMAAREDLSYDSPESSRKDHRSKYSHRCSSALTTVCIA